MNNRTEQHDHAASPKQGNQATASPWWRTAANPVCPDWCTKEHRLGEFAQGGSIVHSAVVAQGDGVTLERVAIVNGDGAPGTCVTEYDKVEATADRMGAQLTNRDGFGVPVGDAVSLAREVLRLAGDRVDQVTAACPRGTTWCTEHLDDTGQCTGEAIQAGEAHCYVWLVLEAGQTDPTVVVDTPPSGAVLTLDQAGDLRDALHQLRETALATMVARS